MSDIIESEILSLLGRLAGEIDDVKRTVHRIARHHDIPQGDVPRTFHVKAQKVDSTPSKSEAKPLKFGEFKESDHGRETASRVPSSGSQREPSGRS